MADLTETRDSRRQDISEWPLKVLKEHNRPPRILHLINISFNIKVKENFRQSETERMCLQQNQKTSFLSLQERPREVL